MLEAFDRLVLGLVVEANGDENGGSRGRWRRFGFVGFLMSADGTEAGSEFSVRPLEDIRRPHGLPDGSVEVVEGERGLEVALNDVGQRVMAAAAVLRDECLCPRARFGSVRRFPDFARLLGSDFPEVLGTSADDVPRLVHGAPLPRSIRQLSFDGLDEALAAVADDKTKLD